ncbi:MAG: sensor hybrid histidine kinase [Acidimicrobiales bacterium]|nr:sensor hybrid histidine kinase [Acidimicrobiales bacterium]
MSDRLTEAEDTLRAIGAGEVDAFVLAQGGNDRRVFALETVDRPYRMFVENMRDGAATISPTGLILFANRRLGELLGCACDTIVGAPFTTYLPRDTSTGIDELRGPDGQGAIIEVDLIDADGRAVPVLIGSVPLTIGDRTFICVTFSDLRAQKAHERAIARLDADRRSLEHRLNQADRLDSLGQLAGGIAHDFNNLLSVILNYASFAAEQTSGAVHDDIGQISAAAERAARLTRQLLIVARRETVNVERLDLNIVVSEMSSLLGSTLGEHVELLVRTDESLPEVEADRGCVDQILLNLAVNARDAMPSGGTLTLRTVRLTIDAALARARSGLEEGEYVSVTIEDTGVGIPHELLSQIFEPFFTTKALGKGTGLGLATVYGIVKQTCGYVYVESTPGHGSRFTVLLPRSAVRAEPTAPPESLPPRGSETILLVEDDRPVRVAVRRMLEGLGYRVHEASNGAEAIGQLETSRERIHLVLTDVVMPDIHGRTLAECVLDQYAEPRVLYMSGYTEDEILQRGLGESGMALLQKPFTLEALARAVRTALR